jgi:hypothetical protein
MFFDDPGIYLAVVEEASKPNFDRDLGVAGIDTKESNLITVDEILDDLAGKYKN